MGHDNRIPRRMVATRATTATLPRDPSVRPAPPQADHRDAACRAGSIPTRKSRDVTRGALDGTANHSLGSSASPPHPRTNAQRRPCQATPKDLYLRNLGRELRGIRKAAISLLSRAFPRTRHVEPITRTYFQRNPRTAPATACPSSADRAVQRHVRCSAHGRSDDRAPHARGNG